MEKVHFWYKNILFLYPMFENLFSLRSIIFEMSPETWAFFHWIAPVLSDFKHIWPIFCRENP